MTKHIAIGVVLLALAFAARADDKKEPFYRRYLVAGNPLDDKIREQEKRVEADPNSAALKNDFANLLAARRLVGDARKQYVMAMKLDKKNFLAAYNLGLLEETEGRTASAISAYEESIKRKPGFPPSHFRLGRLYEQRGSTNRAIEHYAQALRIDQSMRDPRRNPLAADTRLLDRVSLTNYERDLATATMRTDARYADEGRFALTPVDRALNADEAAGAPPPAAAPFPVEAAGVPRGAPPFAVEAPAPAVVVPAPAPTSGRPAPPPAPAPVITPMLGGRPIPPPAPTSQPH